MKYIVLLFLLFMFWGCNEKGAQKHGHLFAITIANERLVTKTSNNADSYERPYLALQLKIKNLSDKKILYKCKAYSNDEHTESEMYIITRASTDSMIETIDAFGVEFINPYAEATINATIPRSVLSKLLNIEVKTLKSMPVNELKNIVQKQIKDAMFVYLSDEKDVNLYQKSWDKRLYLRSDTIVFSNKGISLLTD